MKRITVIIVLSVILTGMSLIPSVMAEPTQQFSKIYLNPYYRPSLLANTNYTYNMMFNPPDGMTNIQSGIISFQIYISPTVNFRLWANGKDCGNYTISTTYASAGLGYISFECSSQLQKGNNVITLRSDKATSSIVGWTDITYVNSPPVQSNVLEIHGTEYTQTSPAKIWLQLVNSSGGVENNASCFVDIYNPDNTQYLERVSMSFLEDGVYYYDLLSPTYVGVYPVIAICYYQTSVTKFTATSGNIIIGTQDGGNIYTATQVLDGNSWKTNEALLPAYYRLEDNMTFSSVVPPSLLTDVTIEVYAKWNGQLGDDIVIYIYNFTGNSWHELPNKITNTGGSILLVSNSMPVTNMTEAGFLNDGYVHIKMNDTYSVDSSKSKLELDYVTVGFVYRSGGIWTQIRGSSEMHISSTLDTGLVSIESLCGSYQKLGVVSPDCSYEAPDPEGLLPEGILIDNVTITPLTNVEHDTYFRYDLPYSVDCTAIIGVYVQNNSNTSQWTDVYPDSIKSKGINENCALRIPFSTGANISATQFQIISDNYLRWEINWSYAKSLALNTTVDYICNLTKNQFGVPYYNYSVPITSETNLTDILEVLYCHRAFDDLYYQFAFYDDSLDVHNAGELEAYLTETRLYMNSLTRDIASLGNFLFQYMNTFTLLHINDTTTQILAKPICNLTYTNVTVQNVTTIYNYTNVYNYTQNVTLQGANISVNFSAPTPKEIWQYFYGIEQSQFEAVAGSQQINPTGLLAFGGIAQALESECINTTSILRFSNSHLCYGGDCFDVNNNRTETCQYGCDMKRNECKADPASIWIMVLVVMLIIIGIFIGAWYYL